MAVESEKLKRSTASKTSNRKTSQISKELTKVTQTLETFSACHKVLVRASDKSELLNRICQAIVEVGGYKMAWVGVVSQDSQKTVKPLAYAGYDDGFLSNVRVTWAEEEKNLCPTGTAIVSREPFVVNNILNHPDVMSWRGEALKRGYGSVIALPLISNGGTFGSLTIFSDEHEGFVLEDVNHLMDLAGNLVYGIVALHTRTERNRAEVEVKKNLKKLRQTLGAIIQVLEKTVEVRDPYTAGHQRRVADLAQSIGAEMGFSQDRIDGIRIAGIIHDIGKIYVPAEILSKPRKLTTFEFNLIKTHPQVGYDILKALNLRQKGPTLIACPSCGRADVDIVSLANRVDELLQKIDRPITVAVMGCEVNGPGEAKDADVGLAAGVGRGVIFRKGKKVRTVPESDMLSALMEEIEKV